MKTTTTCAILLLAGIAAAAATQPRKMPRAVLLRGNDRLPIHEAPALLQ